MVIIYSSCEQMIVHRGLDAGAACNKGQFSMAPHCMHLPVDRFHLVAKHFTVMHILRGSTESGRSHVRWHKGIQLHSTLVVTAMW